MFDFLKKKSAQDDAQFLSDRVPVTQERDPQVHVVQASSGNIVSRIQALGVKPVYMLGYVSPHCDINSVGRSLRQAFPNAVLMLCSTAGELCSEGASLYCETPDTWDSVVLQVMDDSVIQSAELVSIPLECDDLKSGSISLSLENRIQAIRRNIERTNVSMDINAKDTLAYILFDGLSASESFFMEALYDASKFPCLFVGGSAGGKLDFQNTYIHNGSSVLKGMHVSPS